MFKNSFHLLASISAILPMSPALASQQVGISQGDDLTGAQRAGDAKSGEIVVTGTRIRSGAQMPTPVLNVTAANVIESQPVSVAAALAQLPQFGGSTGPRLTQANTLTGAPVGSVLNLRNAGPLRVLVLQDGIRVPPTTAQGLVSADFIPELLVKRIDVVTGGVSAVYGSDAVSGVVNFVLDRNFTGARALAQYGLSSYGDAASYRIAAAAGFAFAGNKGHVLLSGEINNRDGIDRNSRPLTDASYLFVPRLPTTAGAVGSASNPYFLTSNVRNSSFTDNAKLLTGPPSLGVIYFDRIGTQRPFDPGAFAGSANQIGGSGLAFPGDRSLFPSALNKRAFLRIGYDVGPDTTIFAEGTFGTQLTKLGVASLFITTPVFAENAFMPDSVRTAVLAQPDAARGNVSANLCGGGSPAVLCLFRSGRDLTPQQQRIYSTYLSAKVGITGKVLGSWDYSLTFAHGKVETTSTAYNEPRSDRYLAAVDAVRDPATGTIVCRVSLSNPTLYPGCIPYNVFAPGTSSSPELQAFLMGEPSRYRAVNSLDDFVGVIAGSPFSTWAGRVDVSAGVEFRRSSLSQTTNSDPAIPLNLTGLRGRATTLFPITNVGPAAGRIDVQEANVEVLVPLAKDVPLLHLLNVSAAGRFTHYSTSGDVVTWKVGTTYEPVSDIRFRVNLSRDIRAPNAYDLFQGGTVTSSILTDPHCGCTTGTGGIPTLVLRTGGNRLLKPEIGNTFTAGVIFKPSFAKRLVISADYYDIKVSDAIVNLTPAQILQACEDSGGAGPTCNSITRPGPFSDRSPSNVVREIFSGGVNAAKLRIRGVDLEGSWAFRTGRGEVSLRALANYVISYKTQAYAGAPLVESVGFTETSAGQGTPIPKWRGNFTVRYEGGPLTLTVQERFTSSLKSGPQFVYDVKRLPAVAYTDAYAALRVQNKFDIFISVNNVFNKAPPLFPATGAPGVVYPTLASVYDVMGRYITVGVKLAM